jgi:hypothetical protein
MKSVLFGATIALGLVIFGCKGSDAPPPASGDDAGGSGAAGSGGAGGKVRGAGGSASGGSVGSASGGTPGNTGGTPAGTGGDSSSGGAPGEGGVSGGDDASSGGAGGDTSDASPAGDGPASDDAGSGKGPGPGVIPLPGRPQDYICPLNSTHAECCQILCECVNRICIDSPKAKPGIAGCMPTCMKLSDTVTRCHVFNCYESVAPSGVKDHDSHCGHAANQVNGGGCPNGVLP